MSSRPVAMAKMNRTDVSFWRPLLERRSSRNAVTPKAKICSGTCKQDVVARAILILNGNREPTMRHDSQIQHVYWIKRLDTVVESHFVELGDRGSSMHNASVDREIRLQSIVTKHRYCLERVLLQILADETKLFQNLTRYGDDMATDRISLENV
jgi:hypothetical protein